MSEPGTLRRFRAEASTGRPALAGASVLGIAAALVSLAIPWLAGAGLGDLFDGRDDRLPWVLVAIIVALAARLMLEFLAGLLSGRERFRLIAALRRRWYRRILSVPPGGEGEARRQQWVSILSYDIPRISEALVDLPISLTRGSVTFVGALAAMAFISPWLTLVVGAGAPLAYFGTRLLAARLRDLARNYWDVEIEAMTQAEESFRNREIIQAFGQRDRWQDDFGRHADASRAAAVSHLRLATFIGPMTQFVSFCGIVGVVWLGTAVFAVALEPGPLLSFVLYGLLLTQPLRAFADGWGTYQEAVGTLGRFDAIPAAPEGGERDTAPAEGTLEIDGVRFAWGSEDVLRSASLTLSPGEHIALTGENGAGKSTLLSVLLGFVRPDAGQIRFGGVDLADLTIDARLGLFTLVPQSGALIAGTVRENVTFGRPEATDDELARALECALADRFVEELPAGLDTMIREEGSNLSGGQRQRLALARALLADAPIVLFDEATSDYDPEGRVELVRNCRTHLGGKVVIWVTHDAAPLESVDRVIELRDGELFGISAVGDRMEKSRSQG